MIFLSALNSYPNMKALAQILLEISCTQDIQILFSKGHNSKKGHNSDIKKIWVNHIFMWNLYMKFQNPSVHHSNVSNFTEKWKNQSKFQNSVFLSKFDGKFSKVYRVIYFSAPTSIPDMRYFLRYFAHKIFKFCFQRDIT